MALSPLGWMIAYSDMALIGVRHASNSLFGDQSGQNTPDQQGNWWGTFAKSFVDQGTRAFEIDPQARVEQASNEWSWYTDQGMSSLDAGVLAIARQVPILSMGPAIMELASGTSLDPGSNYGRPLTTTEKVENYANIFGTIAGLSLMSSVPRLPASNTFSRISARLKGNKTGGSAPSNPVPNRLARAIPDGTDAKLLGRPGSSDVFVTAADDIQGLNAQQIAQKLTIPENATGFKVIEFETPASGIASPINRTSPGFVGGGQTAGGAREFVIPNQPISPQDIVRTVR